MGNCQSNKKSNKNSSQKSIISNINHKSEKKKDDNSNKETNNIGIINQNNDDNIIKNSKIDEKSKIGYSHKESESDDNLVVNNQILLDKIEIEDLKEKSNFLNNEREINKSDYRLNDENLKESSNIIKEHINKENVNNIISDILNDKSIIIDINNIYHIEETTNYLNLSINKFSFSHFIKIKEISFTPQEYSHEIDYLNILSKSNHIDNHILYKSLLSLNERNWIKELYSIYSSLSTFSTFIKNLIFFNSHFNWLSLSLSEAYFSYFCRKNKFLLENYGLPHFLSYEWLNGFEWKGIFIRVVTSDEYDNIYKDEVEAYKIFFNEYVRIRSDNNDYSIMRNIVFPYFTFIKYSNIYVLTTLSYNKTETNDENIKNQFENPFLKQSFLYSKLTKDQVIFTQNEGRTFILLKNLYKCLPCLLNIKKEIVIMTIPAHSKICSEVNIFSKEEFKKRNKFVEDRKIIYNFIYNNNNNEDNDNQLLNFSQIYLNGSYLKIYYSNNNENSIEQEFKDKIDINLIAHNRIIRFYHNIINSYIEDLLKIKLEHESIDSIKTCLLENNLIEIKGNSIILSSSSKNILYENSLIPHICDSLYIEASLNTILNNFTYMINNLSDGYSYYNSISSFIELTSKYGISKRLFPFLLFKVKHKKISDFIKISILVDWFNQLVNIYDGIIYKIKFNYIKEEINYADRVWRNDKNYKNNEELIDDIDFTMNHFLIDKNLNIKESSLFNLFRNRLFLFIIYLFNIQTSDKSLFDQLDIFEKQFISLLEDVFYINLLELKRIETSLNLSNYNTCEINFKTLFSDCFKSANEMPFQFLSYIEEVFDVDIDELVKFKSSVNVNSFLLSFSELSILPKRKYIISFIGEREIGYIDIIHNISKYDNSVIDNNEDINIKNVNFIKVQYDNQSIKSNLIPKFTTINKNEYFKENGEGNKEEGDRSEEDILFEIITPTRFYKLKSSTFYNNNLYKNKYIVKSYEIISALVLSLEFLYKNIFLYNINDKECLWSLYLSSFLFNFFINKNYNDSQTILNKLKEEIKGIHYINQELYCLICLFDGFLIEKKSFVESAESVYKSIIYCLLLYGDPRGKGTSSNLFQTGLFWKGSKTTSLLENIYISENFKELFHCSDYFNKQMIIHSNKIIKSCQRLVNSVTISEPEENGLYKKGFSYIENSNLYGKINIDDKNKNKTNIQYNNYDDDGFDESINENIYNHIENKEIVNRIEKISYIYRNYLPKYLLEETYNNDYFNENLSEIDIQSIYSYEKINQSYFQLFNFPSTSTKKYANIYKESSLGLIFIMSNINFSNTNRKEINLNAIHEKFGIEISSLSNTHQAAFSIKSLKSIQSVKSGISMKSNIFSLSKEIKNSINNFLLYNILLDLISYYKHLPKGVVISFGNNSFNETSHNDYETLSLPRLVYKLKNEEVIKVKAGWEHNSIITKNRKIFSWGNNESGQCGVSSDKIIFSPKEIKTITGYVEDVCCGNEHSICMIKNEGLIEIYSWGKSDGGVLGMGFIKERIEYFPRKIVYFNDLICNDDCLNLSPSNSKYMSYSYKISSISTGSLHNIITIEEYLNNNYSKSKLFSWGFGEGGQLGFGEKYMSINASKGYLDTPTEIDILPIIKHSKLLNNNQLKVKKISCGEAHSLLLTSINQVFGWGFNSNGQLGLGFCADSFEMGMGMFNSRVFNPRRIPIENVIDVEAGKTYSFFINSSYQLFGCGANDIYQLGFITNDDNTKHLFNNPNEIYNSKCHDIVDPTIVDSFIGMKVLKIKCGESHSLALVDSNNNSSPIIWCWGSNQFGQLGIGEKEGKSLPKPFPYIMNYIDKLFVEDFSCGAYHSLCLLTGRINQKWVIKEKNYEEKFTNWKILN